MLYPQQHTLRQQGHQRRRCRLRHPHRHRHGRAFRTTRSPTTPPRTWPSPSASAAAASACPSVPRADDQRRKQHRGRQPSAVANGRDDLAAIATARLNVNFGRRRRPRRLHPDQRQQPFHHRFHPAALVLGPLGFYGGTTRTHLLGVRQHGPRRGLKPRPRYYRRRPTGREQPWDPASSTSARTSMWTACPP